MLDGPTVESHHVDFHDYKVQFQAKTNLEIQLRCNSQAWYVCNLKEQSRQVMAQESADLYKDH